MNPQDLSVALVAARKAQRRRIVLHNMVTHVKDGPNAKGTQVPYLIKGEEVPFWVEPWTAGDHALLQADDRPFIVRAAETIARKAQTKTGGPVFESAQVLLDNVPPEVVDDTASAIIQNMPDPRELSGNSDGTLSAA